MSSPLPALCVGLMSGTSVDGVDAALAEFNPQGRMRCLAVHSVGMPSDLKAALTRLQQPSSDELAQAALAAASLADLYAQATASLLARAGIVPGQVLAIGAHGQTVRHQPALGYTLQLLDGARLAERTGIDTICDFRSADVAAGGQGAPLVPAFHAGIFGSPSIRRAVVNIGGIANLSLLRPGQPVLGWDTGPGNTLLDGWCARHLGQDFDEDGRWAASATPDRALLSRLLADPYFDRAAPKSTGRDLFNMDWLDGLLEPASAPDVVQSTLLELTCETIARDCLSAGVDEIYLCGGGRRNGELVRRLSFRCAPRPVSGTETLGVDAQAVEALAFAWLAWRRMNGQPGNLPDVTGAAGPRVLGAWYPRPFMGLA